MPTPEVVRFFFAAGGGAVTPVGLRPPSVTAPPPAPSWYDLPLPGGSLFCAMWVPFAPRLPSKLVADFGLRVRRS